MEEAVNVADRELLGPPGQQADRAAAKKRRQLRLEGPLDFEALTKTAMTKATPALGAQSINALQQVGAFVAINPLLQESKRAALILRQIEEHTRKLDKIANNYFDLFQ